MEVSIFKTDDKYDVLSQWWKQWRWTPVDRDFLPDIGFMVNDEGIDVCAGFIYFGGSVAWIEFIVSNPKYRGRERRREALELIVATLVEVARASDRKYCYSLLKNNSLMDVYSTVGFTKGDSNATEMILKL